jgi:hypothetical protein
MARHHCCPLDKPCMLIPSRAQGVRSRRVLARIRAGSGGLAAQAIPARPVPGGPIKLRHWIVPVLARQILVQVPSRDIGQLTDL